MARAPSANYLHASPTARAWDNMSVTEWIERHVPGGVAGQLGGGDLTVEKTLPAAPLELLVSDIDGTLVTPKKALTPRAIQAVASLDAAAVAFTVISSRPPRGMAEIVRRLKVRPPFAAFNGGSLVGPDMQVIAAHRLPADVAKRALAVLARRDIDAWVFADGAWFVRDPHAVDVERERRTVGFEPTVVDDFAAFIGRVDKLVGVCDDPARLSAAEDEVRSRLGGEATIERSQSYYVDITHPRANKGEAVRALAGRLGVDLRHTAVIGDMTNDIAMFRVAGFSMVMGQAPAAVKAEADAATGSNQEDGFAEAVERFVLPRARFGATR